jgi:DMSO reductase anchor subunit
MKAKTKVRERETPPFPKSAYFRLRGSRRRVEVFNPDYPLVFFTSLSRLSQGVAIFAGVFQVMGSGELARLHTAVALGLALVATIISIFHINDRLRFMAMIKNLKSQVSWEVLLSGAYMAVMLINLILLCFIDFRIMGYLVIIIAASVLIATGFAYKFFSHPAWNTNMLAIIYLISGLVLGLSFSSLATGAFFPVISLSLWLLIFIQALMELFYLRHLRGLGLKFILKERIFWAYVSSYFIVPLLLIFICLFKPSVVLFALSFASLILGAFLERVLFFLIERPVYLFKIEAQRY